MVMFISCAGIIALFYIQFILYKMGKQKNFKEFIKSQQLWNVIKELLVIILGVTLAINFTSAVEERETKEKVIKMLDSIDLEIQTEYDLCKILREDYLAGEIDVDQLALQLTHNTAFSEIILNILQFPALTLCNSANGGKALIFRRFRHLPFGRVIRISRRIPA